MKKTVTANTKKYSVEVYFQLGEAACPYTFELTDDQVRRFWEIAADETITADVDVCEVIQTEEDWAYVADAAGEHLFNYIFDNKKLDALMNKSCK